MKKYNSNIGYLETQKLKDYLVRVIVATYRNINNVAYIDTPDVSPHKPVDGSNPYRSINFDTYDGKVMQLENDTPSFLIGVASKHTEGKESLISISSKYYRDIETTGNDFYSDKWITAYVDTDFSLADKESCGDFFNEFYSMLFKFEESITKKNENIFPSISLEKKISIVDWQSISSKYSFLDTKDIFSKISRDNKFNVVSNIDRSILRELSYYDLNYKNRKNLFLITYFNQYSGSPIILGTVSSIDYSNRSFDYNTLDNYKYFYNKIVIEFNIDALSMIFLNKREINEVK